MNALPLVNCFHRRSNLESNTSVELIALPASSEVEVSLALGYLLPLDLYVRLPRFRGRFLRRLGGSNPMQGLVCRTLHPEVGGHFEMRHWVDPVILQVALEHRLVMVQDASLQNIFRLVVSVL